VWSFSDSSIWKLGVLILVLGAGSSVWLSCGGSPSFNLIQIENQKQGDPTWQITTPATEREIEGYASATSVNHGDSISFFVNTAEPSYSFDIYRMGWYGGVGGRKMMPTARLPGVPQPMPEPDPTTGLIECHWKSSYTMKIPYDPVDPTDWLSGVYLVKLTASSSGKQSYIIFVVRDDSRRSGLIFQTAVTTYEAYNTWGGLSLYTAPRRAYKVSFNRPYPEAGGGTLFRWEFYMLRFLEREGYDVSYSTDLDTHTRGDLLLLHKAWITVGHDEYWSAQMRANVEAARDAGVSLGFFSSNNVYWQVRFEPSPITGEPNRTMVCYKSATLDPYYTDGIPDHQHLVTVRFRDPPVNRPEDALVGVMYQSRTLRTYDMVISDASHWIFANTGLLNGSHLQDLLGYEADRMYGHAPPGTVRVAHSPYLYNGAILYSDMTVYTAAAGSTVVATGSMQWSWGLDDYSYPGNLSSNNPAVQQATRNILARFLAPMSR